MKCPICNFQELADNTTSCPECKSDIGLLNDVKTVSKTIRKNIIYFIFLFLLFVCIILIGLKVIHKQKNLINNVQQSVENLTKENISLKNTLSDLQKNNRVETPATADTITKQDKKSQTEYIVQKNDNLWIIAQKFYGYGFKYKKIADDNNISKPYVVLVGTKLKINQ